MAKVSVQSLFEKLRSRAEELLKEKGAENQAEFSEAGMLPLIHELEIHQIELQIQNEELLKAQQELQEAKKAYSDLYELAPIGYVTLSRDGVIVSANQAASNMLGTSKEDLTNRGFSAFIYAKDHATYFALVRDVAEKKAAERSGEVRLLKRKVVPFHAHVAVSPARDSGGHFKGWRIVFMDISDRKQWEAALERSNQELQNFAFVASHDLQEPLRKIQTFTDMVLNKVAENDDVSVAYLRRIQGAAGRMRQLLEALLSYSRVGTRQEPFSECRLHEAVEDVASDLDSLIRRTGGRVEISDLPVIQADTSQVRQLFQNLIANALKFHRDNVPPVVKVYTLHQDEKMCKVAVEDNGIGFEEQYLSKIFTPFQRLHGRSSKYEGTGMGLAIVRKIIERHCGSITAKSVPGEGSTFIIALPVRSCGPAGR